jgi:hypothetical protein
MVASDDLSMSTFASGDQVVKVHEIAKGRVLGCGYHMTITIAGVILIGVGFIGMWRGAWLLAMVADTAATALGFWQVDAVAIGGGLASLVAILVWYGARGNEGGGRGHNYSDF